MQFFRVHAGEVARFLGTQLPRVCDVQFPVDAEKVDASLDHSNEFMIAPQGQDLPALLFPALVYESVVLTKEEAEWITAIGCTAECALYGFESALAVECIRQYIRVGGNYAFVPVSVFESYRWLFVSS